MPFKVDRPPVGTKWGGCRSPGGRRARDFCFVKASYPRRRSAGRWVIRRSRGKILAAWTQRHDGGVSTIGDRYPEKSPYLDRNGIASRARRNRSPSWDKTEVTRLGCELSDARQMFHCRCPLGESYSSKRQRSNTGKRAYREHTFVLPKPSLGGKISKSRDGSGCMVMKGEKKFLE